MKKLKLSLINNDYAVRAHTNLDNADEVIDNFLSFIQDIEEELVTGDTAFVEVEGAEKDVVRFTVSR